MPPCQATDTRSSSNAPQEQDCWGGSSSNASLLRQDSLAYSVSDCGSNYFEDYMDESFETYCDRMDSKEVVVIFENGFHPLESVVCEGQQQVIDQDMMDKVKNMRISSQQDRSTAQKHGSEQAWQFPEPVSNYKENSHACFHQMRSSHTAMAS